MAKKANCKIDNDSLSSSPLSKIRNKLMDPFYWMISDVPDDYLRDLATEYLDYLDNNPNVIRIYTFFAGKRISTTTIDTWRKKSILFNAAYELGKDILAERREKDAWEHGGALTIFLKTQHLYDAKWLEINKYLAALKKEEGTQSEVRYVYLEKPKVKSKDEMEAEKNPDITVTVKE